jgi:hypothetical protein
MSLEIFEKILDELGIFLSEFEKASAYKEIVEYLGIAGSVNECEALEQAWSTPEHREAIEKYIKRLKKRKKKEILVEH